MKTLKKADNIYLEEYEVSVSPYLSMPQIGAIINGVCAVQNSDYYERKMNEDMLVLLHATSIGKETLEELEYEDLVTSGLVHTVRENVMNIGLVKEGIEYSESLARSFASFAPKILPIIEKVGDLYGSKQTKEANKKRS